MDAPRDLGKDFHAEEYTGNEKDGKRQVFGPFDFGQNGLDE